MMTCIAIDDEPKALEVIERYCQKIGLVSLKATFREPLKAIEFLHCEKVDLIFLDINMPAMDGWEFMEEYKKLPEEQKADIVLIMLTTSLNPDDELRTLETPEIAGFENKPLKQDRLEKILNKYFGG